jgi:putative Mg2+ transporter-C (MgtC) family protein
MELLIKSLFASGGFMLKCLLAIILGGMIGLERERKHKPAGVKTHVLICIGAAVLTYLSSKFAYGGDPGRIAAQIVSGIGFIGAGTILQSKRVVQGLTTAATLWFTASIGMLVGAGFYIHAIIAIVFILPILIYSDAFTGPKTDHYSMQIEITEPKVLETIGDMMKSLDLVVYRKKILRVDDLMLELSYSAPPLVHHIFFKRLIQLEGLGDIIKI